MNPTIFLLAGALALAPIGYFALEPEGTSHVSVTDPTTAEASAVVSAGDGQSTASANEATSIREPERYEGTQTITLSAGFPYPTCPLQCTVGYGFFGSGGLEFPVPEGAKRILVKAEWDALLPAVQTLHIGLFVENGCGEGCWMGVERGEGTGSVTFVHLDPEPGTYGVYAGGTGPVYVVADQDVRLEAVVEFS